MAAASMGCRDGAWRDGQKGAKMRTGVTGGVTNWGYILEKWGYRSGVIGVQITEGGNYTFFAVNCEETTPLPTKFLYGYTLLYIVYRGLAGLPALAGGGKGHPGGAIGKPWGV